MVRLMYHGLEILTPFDLLGEDENDLTRALGWTLAKSPTMLHRVVRKLFPAIGHVAEADVRLQEYGVDRGFTDIQVEGSQFQLIVEAKKGWALPGQSQLKRYANRLRTVRKRHVRPILCVLSECSPEYAERWLNPRVGRFPVKYLSWANVLDLCDVSVSTQVERSVLRDLKSYLGRVTAMQQQKSNLVYVVALGSGRPTWSKFSWQDYVTKKRIYFHPLGVDGYPKESPNYIGFRFDGQLKSIHHIDHYEVVDAFSREITGRSTKQLDTPNLLYRLGPPIIPHRKVHSGRIRNARMWIMIDLLLTSASVQKAAKATRQRERKLGL